jgi:hypothetical protein
MRIVTRAGCGLVLTACTALGAGPAAAGSGDLEDPFMRDLKQTVYATEHHMAFSMRSSIIRWFGGVPVVSDKDLRAAERDRWWGPAVPNVPAEPARETAAPR